MSTESCSRVGDLKEDVLVQTWGGGQVPCGANEMGWELAKDLESIPFI